MPSLTLCERKDASEWSKEDYPYIQRGFIQPFYRILDAWSTYIHPNNETANVYSQLLGLPVFLGMLVRVWQIPTGELMNTAELQVTEAQAEQRRFFFELMLMADILCCSCSLVTHMYQSRSRRWHDVLAVCDWSGTLIITLVAVAGLDSIDMTAMITQHVPYPLLRDALLVSTGPKHLVFAVCTLAAILLVLSLAPTSHFFRFALVFVGIVFLCLPGVTVAVFAAPATALVGVACFAIGGTFFGSHYPEKAVPRTFDIYCPSHMFWHIFYQLGLVCANLSFAHVFFGQSPF